MVDTTSTISHQAKRQINETCQRVRETTSGEILVCVIPTTNGRNPRQFATDLFNRWGIGDEYADNGILVFVAMNDRKAEIVLGDGIDSAREETLARTVMSDYMMPQFKQGNPSKGIRVAVDECAKRFFSNAKDAVQLDLAKSSESDPLPRLRSSNFETDPVVLAESVPADIDFAPPVAAVQPPQFQPQPGIQRGNNGGGMGVRLLGLLAGGLTMGGAGFGLHHLVTRRRRPRNCPHCGQSMLLLDEVRDDEHLDSGERIEERMGSVDYDVWVCSGCDHAQKLRYGKFFSKYSKCPGCRAKTSTSTSRTVRSATTMMSGLREVETTCAHCDYHDITQHTIPIVTQTNHASSNFSSGGGSSFGGGGTSSGGGASGSW